MSKTNIEGYRALGTAEDLGLIASDRQAMLIGVEMSQFNRVAPNTLEVAGETYQRGSMTVVPQDLAAHYCSVREYHKVKR